MIVRRNQRILLSPAAPTPTSFPLRLLSKKLVGQILYSRHIYMQPTCLCGTFFVGKCDRVSQFLDFHLPSFYSTPVFRSSKYFELACEGQSEEFTFMRGFATKQDINQIVSAWDAILLLFDTASSSILSATV